MDRQHLLRKLAQIESHAIEALSEFPQLAKERLRMILTIARYLRSDSATEDRAAPSEATLPADRGEAAAPRTLADVICVDRSSHAPSEKEWVALVQAVASRDQAALFALYERAYRPVFGLIKATLRNRELAEELVGDVFQDIWRDADIYHPSDGPVLAWIMNTARFLIGTRGHRFFQRPHAVGEDYDGIAITETARIRLDERMASSENRRSAAPSPPWREPEWSQVAPAISCKALANDTDEHIVSMIVRLMPGGEYPAHVHAGREELHLLQGELWIHDRKLYPGDYNRAEPGTVDSRVWSETGCTCVLITSTRDVLS